jgi:hypothetical protein
VIPEPDQEWFCAACGVPYGAEHDALECQWLDETYGIGANPTPLPHAA